jgi:hypothetical protein
MLNVNLIIVNIQLTNMNVRRNSIDGTQLPGVGTTRRPGSISACGKIPAARRNLARHVELTHRTGLTSMSYLESAQNTLQYTQPEVP